MNNEPGSPDEVISRHFDDATSSAERAALAIRLISDSEAALHFTATARVHALLEAAAPPRTATRSGILRRRIGFFAAAALIAATLSGVALLLRPHDISQIHAETAGEFVIRRKPLPPGVNLRAVKVSAAATSVPPVSLEALLSGYYIHADPNGRTVPEALNSLEEAIRVSNLLRRPELDALQFTAGPSVIPPVVDPPPLPELRFERPVVEPNPAIASFLAPPFTIREYLDVCSLYREVVQEPGGRRYAVSRAAISPWQMAPKNANLTTRTFRIARDLDQSWLPVDVSQITMQSRFPALFGVTLGDHEMVEVSPDRSWFRVRSIDPKLDRIQQILETCGRREVVQHYITTKLILCPPELLPAGFDPGTGMLLGDSEFQMFCRRLSLEPGVDLATAPAIILRAGQPSAIELLREVAGRPLVEPLESDWFGLRMEILTTCVGETIQISGLMDTGLPGSAAIPFSEIIGNPNAFVPYGAEHVIHYRTGFDLWVPDRFTAVFTLDMETGGRGVAVACVTAQFVSPAGEPRQQAD